ncbi:MAG: MMPL family transporter [Actinomycetales bacterium]
MPADHPVSVAGSVLREQFPGYDSSPYTLVLLSPGSPAEVADYALAVSEVPNVASVTTEQSVIVDGEVIAPNPAPATYRADDAVRITVISEVSPLDADGAALVTSLRQTAAPAEELLVGGVAAAFVDATAGIADHTWIVALWIAVATLIILFLYTGSLLLPIKAVLLNVLSLAATLGALVWVFQGHHLTWLTGDYIETGRVDISTVALIAVTAFALSMDYELFLLSRIKEEHDAGLSTTEAVALGLQRTGRIITAAALLIAVVFAAFLTSGTTNIKQLGFGVTFAILVDATIVRGLLVPAFMRIAGRWNWWAPPFLARVHARVGLRDS